jgi:hypothetical protein
VKAVLDTNVLISGIFFAGQPRAVLDARAAGRFELVLSPSIFDQYVCTCDRLGAAHEDLNYEAILATISGTEPLLPVLPLLDPPQPTQTTICPSRVPLAMVPSSSLETNTYSMCPAGRG